MHLLIVIDYQNEAKYFSFHSLLLKTKPLIDPLNSTSSIGNYLFYKTGFQLKIIKSDDSSFEKEINQIQPWPLTYKQLLNMPYVNEVFLRGQNLS